MVRTREFNPDTALAQVVDLFAAKGYAETSMDDIVRATGVSRYGLYNTFGNKRELFEQALDCFANRMGKKSFMRLLEPEASIASIRTIFDERIGDMCCEDDAKGCLFIHTAMSLAPENKDIRDVLHHFMVQMSKTFAIGLRTAQAKGEVRADLDLRAAGEMLTSTMFGLAVLARAGYRRDALQSIVNNTLAPMLAVTRASAAA
jgi:TetR/AcrR family transcriptional repressor of nem operon